MVDDEQADPRIAALRDLLQSEGWRLLREQVDREWGPVGVGRRMVEAIEKVGSGPERVYELADAAEWTYATAKAVNELVAWPNGVLRALTAGKATPLTSVRDRMLATMRGRRRTS